MKIPLLFNRPSRREAPLYSRVGSTASSTGQTELTWVPQRPLATAASSFSPSILSLRDGHVGLSYVDSHEGLSPAAPLMGNPTSRSVSWQGTLADSSARLGPPSPPEWSEVSLAPLAEVRTPDPRSPVMQELALSPLMEQTSPPRTPKLRKKAPHEYPLNEADIKRAVKNAVSEVAKNAEFLAVSPRFLLSMIDFRESVSPMTPRRAVHGAAMGCVIGAVVFTQVKYHWFETVAEVLRYNNLIAMILIYAVEPVIQLFILLVARIPPQAQDAAEELDGAQRRSGTEETALVIPSHATDDDTLRTVLNAALVHFSGRQIFLVDNGNQAHPTTLHTKNFVASLDPDIHYIWSPKGNKNFAQYAGAQAAREYRYIFAIDDDVSLPRNFRAPVDRISDDVKGVAIPIQAINGEGERPVFVGWQDAEYKMSGLNKLMEDATCGVMYPHGAGSFWDRDTFLQVLRRHDCIFFGEDIKLGLGLQALNKKMSIDAGITPLKTAVPTTIFGKTPNYYTQRVRSWEMGRHLFYGRFTKSLFSMNGQRTLKGVAVQKLSHTYALLSNFVDWARVPLMAAMVTQKSYWLRFGPFFMAPIAPLLVFKYVKARHRPDLDIKLSAALTFPFYKQLYSTLSVMGAVRAAATYIAHPKQATSIPEMENKADPLCFWMQPEFLMNPGFLGDVALNPEAADMV